MPDERRVIVAEPPRTCVIGKPSKIKELRQLTTQDGTVSTSASAWCGERVHTRPMPRSGNMYKLIVKHTTLTPVALGKKVILKVYIGFLERAIL